MKHILIVLFIISSISCINIYAADTVDVYNSSSVYLEFSNLYYGKYIKNDSTSVKIKLHSSYNNDTVQTFLWDFSNSQWDTLGQKIITNDTLSFITQKLYGKTKLKISTDNNSYYSQMFILDNNESGYYKKSKDLIYQLSLKNLNRDNFYIEEITDEYFKVASKNSNNISIESISLYNLSGKKVVDDIKLNENVDIQYLNDKVYFLIISTVDEIVTLKLIF